MLYSPTLMKIQMRPRFEIPRRLKSKPALFVTLLLLATLTAGGTQAQQRMSKRYPAAKNVRVELKNISATITVESCNKDEIKLTAVFDSPKANISPRQTNDALIVDVRADNRGRSDVGNVNFTLQVPVNSSVDLQTMRGQISVSNIRGDMVSAHVSSEGDITLSELMPLFAQNTIGDVFFDGEFPWKLPISVKQRKHQHSHSGKLGFNLTLPRRTGSV